MAPAPDGAPRVTRRECTLVLVVTVFVLLLTTLPYLVGYAQSTPAERFLGSSDQNSVDTYTYLSFIEQAREGHVLGRNLYTPERHEGFWLRPVYLVGGGLAALLHAPNDVAFHALRALTVVIFVVVLHAFARRFFASVRDRILFLLLATLASGLGWLLGTEATPSADLLMPETVTFLSLYTSPHFTMSLVYILVLVGSAADAFGMTPFPATKATAPVGFAAGLLLGLEHPYDLLSLVPVFALWLVGRRQKRLALPRSGWLVLGASLGGAALGMGYQALALRGVPIYAAMEQRNVLPSPPFSVYLRGYGLLVPLAIYGAARLRRSRPEHAALVELWAVLPVFLSYLPLRCQRRLVEGAQLGLALLATIAVAALVNRLRSKWARSMATTAVLGVLVLSNVAVVQGDLRSFSTRAWPFFEPAGLNAGFLWLRDHSPEDSVVITSPLIAANLLPGVSGRHAFAGHPIMTLDFEARRDAAALFLAGAGPAPPGVDYVLESTTEPAFVAPAGWTLAADQDGFRVYRRAVADGSREARGR